MILRVLPAWLRVTTVLASNELINPSRSRFEKERVSPPRELTSSIDCDFETDLCMFEATNGWECNAGDTCASRQGVVERYMQARGLHASACQYPIIINTEANKNKSSATAT